MNIEKEREVFEAWLKSLNENGRTTYFLGQESTVAWEAWQAAKAQVVPSKLDEINNWAKWHIEDYQISESNEHDRGWYNACCAVVNMLEAQEQNQ